MEERRLGRYYHSGTETEWRVEEWGKRGSVKNIDTNRLTRSGLNSSQFTTFSITYPNGEIRYLSFAGFLPSDLDDLVAYWIENESL
jgi:hypothetical protein